MIHLQDRTSSPPARTGTLWLKFAGLAVRQDRSVAGTSIDADAQRAYATLTEQVHLTSRYRSSEAQQLGSVATARYRKALEASTRGPATESWTDFIRAVWDFIQELNRCRPQPTRASRAARGALDRLIVENLDLIEWRRPA
jgi:hypothetical protein